MEEEAGEGKRKMKCEEGSRLGKGKYRNIGH